MTSKILTAELLERYHGLVELLILVGDDLLLLPFSNNNTSVTPTELVHAPEGIDGQEETVDRVEQDIHYHPSDKHKLALDDEDESLETTGEHLGHSIVTSPYLQAIRRGQHDKGDCW